MKNKKKSDDIVGAHKNIKSKIINLQNGVIDVHVTNRELSSNYFTPWKHLLHLRVENSYTKFNSPKIQAYFLMIMKIVWLAIQKGKGNKKVIPL